jgi:hypothetical protein
MNEEQINKAGRKYGTVYYKGYKNAILQSDR